MLTHSKQQQGIVLVITLMMLLLLTLTSASQIRQNQLQLQMTSVLQQQTQTFASAEQVLRGVQNYIDGLRYSNKAINHCNMTNGVYTQLPVPASSSGIGGSTPYVIPKTALPINLTSSNIGVPLSNGSTARITQTFCLANNSMDEQDCTNNQTSIDSYCYASPYSLCSTEIYTIEVNFFDSNTNNRKIISRYAVKCNGPV